MILLWGLLGALGLLVLLEVAARIYYRAKFLVPFRSKRIGEYPFMQFVEQDSAPLYFKFKKGFRSPQININQMSMRGPEPAPDGFKRRMLLIGESNFFGSKLKREKDLWSIVLQDMLATQGKADWEVLNAGFPGYNTDQIRAWWNQELKAYKPEIVTISIGGNDISQAYVMGSKWRPGAPWPWEFIMAQQRSISWWSKQMMGSCAYFVWRRRALTERKGFESGDKVFPLQECIEHDLKHVRAITREAQALGCKVALINGAPAFDLAPTPQDERRLDSIQSNWKENYDTTGRAMLDYLNNRIPQIAEELDVPVIDLAGDFWGHRGRFLMYHDVLHWNADGHRLAAEVIHRSLDQLGWWQGESESHE